MCWRRINTKKEDKEGINLDSLLNPNGTHIHDSSVLSSPMHIQQYDIDQNDNDDNVNVNVNSNNNKKQYSNNINNDNTQNVAHEEHGFFSSI